MALVNTSASKYVTFQDEQGYGAYNLTGNSKAKTGVLTGAVGILTAINPVAGAAAAYVIGAYGEDKLTQRSINLGKSHAKKN